MTLGPTKATVRLAGLVYLLVMDTGIFNLLYVDSTLIVMKDNPVSESQISLIKCPNKFWAVSVVF